MIDYRLGFKQRVRRPPSVWVGHRGAVTSNANASDMHNTAHLRWEQLRPALSIHHRQINLEKEEEHEVYSGEGKGGGGGERSI